MANRIVHKIPILFLSNDRKPSKSSLCRAKFWMVPDSKFFGPSFDTFLVLPFNTSRITLIRIPKNISCLLRSNKAEENELPRRKGEVSCHARTFLSGIHKSKGSRPSSGQIPAQNMRNGITRVLFLFLSPQDLDESQRVYRPKWSWTSRWPSDILRKIYSLIS